MDGGLAHEDTKYSNILLVGYALYSVAFVIKRTEPSYALVLFVEVLQFLGICLFLIALFGKIKLKHTTTGYVKIILTLLFIWFYFLIAWSFRIDFDFIKRMLFEGEGGFLTYVVPLVVFIPKKIFFLKKTVRTIFILGLIYLLFLFLYKDFIFKIYDINSVASEKYVLEYGTKWLSINLGIILLLYPYYSKKIKIIVISIIIIALIAAVYSARRTLIFMSLFPLIMAGFIYIANSRYKFIAFIAGVLLFLGLLLVGYELYSTYEDGFFSNISSRIDQDTRTGVNECFYDDFTMKDWIIGRGFEGSYFCPNIDENYEVIGYRPMIETDFLNIILKSGSVYLFLLLALMVPAIFKGWFRSKNILSKAAASWIFFWIVSLYPANVFAFSFNYLLVWLSVGICFSEKIRLTTDKTLQRYFTMF